MKLHSLIDLFRSSEEEGKELLPLSKIEIPIIQRDYAQGRNVPEVNRIRKRFLSSIYDALIERKPLKLDFIYGDIDANRVLTPLDGQQRLTTLFLLHWYIARHEDVEEDKIAFLKKFSYETRFSARMFCQHLVDYKPDFSGEKLSDDITDQSWMPLDWKNDPTISAMLNMLDDIHTRFRATTDIWPLLEQGYISFYFLSIKGMGLTDELYIKMNSRGKPLTEFEHFKAEWEGYMQLADMETADRISRKIDLSWTDILWPYKGENDVIDDEFVKYYKYLCALLFYMKYPTETIPEDIFDLTKELFHEKTDDVKTNLAFIEHAFDCLDGLNIKESFSTFLTNEQHIDNKSHVDESVDVFEHCCRAFGEYKSQTVRSFSIGRMLLLYCFILYWENTRDVTNEQFSERIRVVNNMIKASEFELREDHMPALLQQAEEIILTGEINIIENRNTFNALQVQEEKDKKEWRTTHPDMVLTLQKLEDHPLLNGSIGVVGLDHIDYTDRFYSLFDCDRGLVNRALLTLGDYSLKIRWRYQIGSAKIDTTWKAIFHANKENTKRIHDLLVALLDKSEMFTNEALQSIIADYLSSNSKYDWRHYLIKYESMRPEKYGMYYWYEHDKRGKASYNILMMLTEKSIGGRNYNIFLKTLHDTIKATYPEKAVRLGEYAFQNDGNRLELKWADKIAYFTDNQFIVNTMDNGQPAVFSIKQEQGIDIEDRIELAWKQIQKL